tara:strand:+ start:28474 stop:28776 length:303 start_codon:yes stop_codon:yes gene_type:complete
MRFPLTKLILPLIALILIFYFGYHLIQGDHGWMAWKQLETKLTASRSKLDTLSNEQETWKNRVKLMRPDTLDPDMLDERVRHVLGNIKENEVLVIDEEER